MQQKYIKVCGGCKKQLRTANQRQRRHIKCKKPKRVRVNYYSKQALSVRGRDKHQCRKCKTYLGGNVIRYEGQVHHIDGNTGNNDEKNLILLCTPCHREIHKKGIESIKEILK